MEIEIDTFVINGSMTLTSLPIDKFKVNPGKKQKRCSCRVFDLKSNRIHLAQVIFKLWVVYGQNIIDVPICEIEPRCQLFPAG